MTNNQLIDKLKKDMQMRNFSHYTYDAYLSKTKEMIRYFKKPMEEVTTEELRNFLQKHLKEERKLSDRSINYYNSIIRFVYEVTLDKILNKKQLPMRKQKRTVYKVLTKEELSTFFNCVDNFKFSELPKEIANKTEGKEIRQELEKIRNNYEKINSRIIDYFDISNKNKEKH